MGMNQENKNLLERWEGSSGFLPALKIFFPLCIFILFRPVEFFRFFLSSSSVTAKQRLRSALIFGVIFGYIKLFLDVANLFWFKIFSKNLLSAPQMHELSLVPPDAWQSPYFLLRPLFILLVTIILVVLGSKFIYGFEKISVPAVIVVCYRSVADLFYALPFVGSIFALSWSAALLIVGLKEVYRMGFLRAFLAGIVMPVIILFSVLFAAGPVFNRMIFAFFPEMKSQVVKINDLTAFVNTQAVIDAALDYKKDLGFYPVNLDVLKKYLSSSVSFDVTDPRNSGGYRYIYRRIDDYNFELITEPAQLNISGTKSFYTSQDGNIHLGSPAGKVIKNVSEIDTGFFTQ